MEKNGRSKLAFHATCHDFLHDLNGFISTSLGTETRTLSSSNYSHAKRTVTQMGWYRGSDISKIISLMYPDNEFDGTGMRYDFCERKFNRCKYFQTLSNLPRKDRLPYFEAYKVAEMKREVYKFCAMMEANAKAICDESRVFDKYNFTNSWTNLLQTIVLREDGTPNSCWQSRLKEWFATRRYNHELHMISTHDLFQGYCEWKMSGVGNVD